MVEGNQRQSLSPRSVEKRDRSKAYRFRVVIRDGQVPESALREWQARTNRSDKTHFTSTVLERRKCGSLGLVLRGPWNGSGSSPVWRQEPSVGARPEEVQLEQQRLGVMDDICSTRPGCKDPATRTLKLPIKLGNSLKSAVSGIWRTQV